MLITHRLWPTWLVLFACGVGLNLGCKGNGQKPDVLTGWVTQTELFRSVPQYQIDFDTHQPDSQAIALIQGFSKEVEILVFLGTWCPDCAREVPRFLKTIEVAGNPHLHARLLALDRNKTDQEGLVERHQIEFIPTFVFSVDGRELGRVVEKAELSIEEDMAVLLSGHEEY